MIFTNLWAFGLFVLVAGLAVLAIARFREKEQLFRRFGDPQTLRRLTDPLCFRQQKVKALMVIASLSFLLIAITGPRWGRQFKESSRQGSDVLVAVDVSTSMLAEDIKPNRLTQAKRELGILLQRLAGDRIGLIAFAGQASLQCPLTLDYEAAQSILELIEPGLIPDPGTSISDAIQVACDSFPKNARKYKALVLLTDGEDHSNRLPDAIKRAQEEGLRLFVIGFGSTQGDIIPLRDAQGNLQEYKKDKSGQPVVSKLNEAALLDMTEKTVGKYYRASQGEVEVDRIVEDIGKMEKRTLESRVFNRYTDRFQWPLAIALFLMLLEFLWPEKSGHLGWCFQQTRDRVASFRKGSKAAGRVAGALALLIFFHGTSDAMGRAALRANRAYTRGDYAQAASNYTEVAKENPNDPAPHFNAGNALYRQKQYPQAALSYEKAQTLSQKPAEKADSAYNAGNALFRQNKFSEAVEKYKDALRKNPNDEDAKFNLEMAQKFVKQSQQQQQSKQDKSGNKDQQPDQKPQETKPTQAAPDGSMSKEDAERLLKAIEDQEKMSRKESLRIQPSGVKTEQDW